MKVLVTGAGGFVGSHIVKKLVEEKYEVICAVRKTSNLSKIKDLPVSFKYGDLNDRSFLKDCAASADIIVHSAAIVRAFKKEEYLKENTENTANFCKAILEVNPGLKKFIFISSQAAMGPSSSYTPKKLDETNNPVSDYGLSKIAAEKEIKDILSGKVPYTVLRPASVYGPGDKDIFIFFNLVNKHLRPFTLTERFIQLVYVEDVAAAVAASVNNSKSDNKTYYLAYGKPYTWSDVGRIISKETGRTTLPVPVPDFVFKIAGIVAQSISYITKKPAILNKQKISEILQKYWIADNSAAENDLGIKFTELEIASKITYNWYLINRYFSIIKGRRLK